MDGDSGIRWGVDDNEDGAIDYWKMISAEEVSSEVVDAIRERDGSRFKRLLITAAELDALGLGAEKKTALQDKVTASARCFCKVQW